MAIYKSNRFVAAAQAVQRRAVEGMEKPPHMAVMRFIDPDNRDRYRPTGSYNLQIRNHAGAIGVKTSVSTVYPDSPKTVIETARALINDSSINGVMTLYPLAKERKDERHIHDLVKEEFEQRPEADIDDLLGRRHAAPTPSSMFANANLMLHRRSNGGPEYFEGRRLDELRRLSLPDSVTADQLIIGGRGELTMGPGLTMLEDQGIYLDPSQIITYENRHRWGDLPEAAVILTATPAAGQIRERNVRPGTVIADGGFGIIDGRLYGNADPDLEFRGDVLWTPPQEGIGPGSTTYLHQELLYASGLRPTDIEPLSAIALDQAVEYAR